MAARSDRSHRRRFDPPAVSSGIHRFHLQHDHREESTVMRLSDLSLVLFLILYGIAGYGWMTLAYWVLPFFALVAGILYLLEGLGAFGDFVVGPRRPRP